MQHALRGRRGWVLLAGAALFLGATAQQSASASTVGGDQLSSAHRTVSLGPGADPLPDVWAQTWIIADATTGQVLAQKGSHVLRAPASTLKMLTALAVMPDTSPSDTFVATRKAAATYGTRVGLRPGRAYLLDDLWYAVFLPSANDAAIAVAEANGGVRKTIRQMNATAHRLQAYDTTARSPNGLDRPGQLTSAYDLALIARAGLARPDFAKYAGTARASFPDVKGKGRHTIYTTNRLLLHGYRGMIGVKTGYTTKAGRTYVGAAHRSGRTLIVALMGIHESSETAARKLLDWGFANRDDVTPIGQLVEPVSDTPPSATVAQAVGGARATGALAISGAASVADSGPGPTWKALALALCLVLVAIAALVARLLARRRSRLRSRGRHAANGAEPQLVATNPTRS